MKFEFALDGIDRVSSRSFFARHRRLSVAKYTI